MLVFQVANVGCLEFKEFDPQIVRIFSDDGSPLPNEEKLEAIKAEVRSTETFSSFLRNRFEEKKLITSSGVAVKLLRA